MRFRWLERFRREPTIEPEVAPPPTRIEDATHARALSENGLRDAQQRDGAVRAAAGSLRRLRHENHFAEAMSAIFRERHT